MQEILQIIGQLSFRVARTMPEIPHEYTVRVARNLGGLTPHMIYKLVQKYSGDLGFKIRAHALRATAATNALDNQADIAKVKDWLGPRQHRHHPALRSPQDAPGGQSDV